MNTRSTTRSPGSGVMTRSATRRLQREGLLTSGEFYVAGEDLSNADGFASLDLEESPTRSTRISRRNQTQAALAAAFQRTRSVSHLATSRQVSDFLHPPSILRSQNAERPIATTQRTTRSTTIRRFAQNRSSPPPRRSKRDSRSLRVTDEESESNKKLKSAATVDTVSPPEEEEEAQCCPICLEDTDFPTVASINGCSHSFCFDCIEKWAEQENTCPLCKSRFSKIERVYKHKGKGGRRGKNSNGSSNGLKNSKRVRYRDQGEEERGAQLQFFVNLNSERFLNVEGFQVPTNSLPPHTNENFPAALMQLLNLNSNVNFDPLND